MKIEPFYRLPKDALLWLHKAADHQSKGWTDTEYKACYLAFVEQLKGESVSPEKFEALIRFWVNEKRNKTFKRAEDRGHYRMFPNKMLQGNGWETKSFIQKKSPLANQSPFASAYSNKIEDVVNYSRKAMNGGNFV